MTLLRPMFPPQRRAAGVPALDPAEVLDVCDGEHIVLLRPVPPPQKSCFELYPLPFFDRRHDRRFWSVEPSGNYSADCETGRELAVAFLQSCDRTNGWCALLGWIVADMIAAGKGNGVIVGFMSVIGVAVAVGADVAMEADL